MGDIHNLHQSTDSPYEVLNRTLERHDDIASLVIVIKMYDGNMHLDSSTQKVSDLCMSAVALLDEANQAMKGEKK